MRIAVSHPSLSRGGSEARALWTIQALKDDCAVTLLTSGEVDLAALNAYYGTSLALGEFSIEPAPMPRFLRGWRGGTALRNAFFQRHCRRLARRFDVLISAYNLCDFGVPAIQCIADFSWDDKTRLEFDPTPGGVRGAFHHRAALRRPYMAASRWISGSSGRSALSPPNVVLANSAWTARRLRSCYGIESEVVYPPVWSEFPPVTIRQCYVGFVYIGRISPEKRIERILLILREVRRRGHDVHLHIIGEMGKSTYGEEIRALCDQEGPWVVCEGSQSGAAKARLLTRHRFGINAREGEAFGISVAEMVKAGCITFVPASGGQAEIVDHSDLTYASDEEAVQKILAVLGSDSHQDELRAHLARRAEVFSAAGFMDVMRRTVHEFANSALKGGAGR